MLSQQLIEELKNIIRKEYEKNLETSEVVQIAENLVGYFDLLAKIHYRDNQSYTNKIKNNPRYKELRDRKKRTII